MTSPFLMCPALVILDRPVLGACRWSRAFSISALTMLGHTDLKTTRIYTQVSIRQPQEIQPAAHPAKLEQHLAGDRVADVLDYLADLQDEDAPLSLETTTAIEEGIDDIRNGS